MKFNSSPKLLLSFMFVLLSQASFAACLSYDTSLNTAKNKFKSQCQSARIKDCDPIEGLWVCSSQTISSKRLADLNINQQITRTQSSQQNQAQSSRNALYSQSGTDPNWSQVLRSKKLTIGRNSSTGFTGSRINVNNQQVETGYGRRGFTKNIRIHTVGNSTVYPSSFAKWSRWYQTDGNTQVFRLFKDETNVRNNRSNAARIESYTSRTFRMGQKWQEWTGRYTIVNANGCGQGHGCSIFQSKSSATGEEWGVMLKLDGNGDLTIRERSGADKKVLRNLNGKSFDVRIRDNGRNFEAFINGKLAHKGSWARPRGKISFRWGMYMGKSKPSQDIMLFVSGANARIN